jgi:hypothetical protein
MKPKTGSEEILAAGQKQRGDYGHPILFSQKNIYLIMYENNMLLPFLIRLSYKSNSNEK